jgi:mannose-6-phosphate isomerase
MTAERPPASMPSTAAPDGPWRLEPNRVGRFYTGGALLDQLCGVPPSQARDTDRPEDWLGSVTSAWTAPGEPPTTTGLSAVDAGDGPVLLRDLLERDPDAIGGADLVARAGPTTGLLVKLLDAGVRLPVHCHPSRAFARRHLDAFFGKAEAWVILATREIAGAEPPNLRLGFRRPIGRDELRRIVETGDTETLLAAMHARPARAGETWFVPPGVPHAIGAGVLIAEVQEPADISLLAETRGIPIAPVAVTAGMPMEVALEAFDRSGRDDAWVDGLRQPLGGDEGLEGARRTALLGDAARPFFRAERIVVTGPARPWTERAFLVGIVLDGAGVARVDDATLQLSRGSTFAVPAAGLPRLDLEARRGGDLTLLAALPPRPEDIDLDEVVP